MSILATSPKAPTAPASIKKAAGRAAAWSMGAYGAAQVIRTASSLVLTRMLAPEVFGLMALVQVFLQGLQLFSDVGIGPSLVQNKRGEDRDFVNTAWTIQAGRGVLLWIAGCALAYPAAMLYAEPAIAAVLPVVALNAVILGLGSTKVYTCQRHLALGYTTVVELIQQVVAVCVTITAAYFSPTVWALVIGSISGATTRLVLSHLWLPGPLNRFHWDRTAVGDLVRFGKWVFMSTAIGFIAGQADRLIIGKLMSMEMLGVYSIAVMITLTPRHVLSRLGGSVLFPSVARKAELPRDELRAKLQKARWPLLVLMACALAVLAGVGDIMVRLLWPEPFHDAGWMLAYLALGLWPTVLLNTMGPALRALGQPQWAAWGDLLRLITIIAAMIVGYELFGLTGLVIGIACSEVPKYAMSVVGQNREKLFGGRQDLSATFILLTLYFAIVLIRLALGLGWPFLPPA